MKKSILKIFGVFCLSLSFITFSCSSDDGNGGGNETPASFKVTNGAGGEEITNGKQFVFNSIGSDNDINIQIKNQSDQNLYFKLKAESGQNHTGVAVNFCFGEICLFNFNPGTYVPPTIYPNVEIAPGQTNDVSDKFFITPEAVIENTPTVFEFGLYQYDSDDQDQTTGTKVLSFSYKYQP